MDVEPVILTKPEGSPVVALETREQAQASRASLGKRIVRSAAILGVWIPIVGTVLVWAGRTLIVASGTVDASAANAATVKTLGDRTTTLETKVESLDRGQAAIFRKINEDHTETMTAINNLSIDVGRALGRTEDLNKR